VAAVTVELPTLLGQLLQGRTRVEVEAETLGGALEALVAAHRVLAVHLFHESGELRRHVLCFHDGTNSRWLEGRGVPLADGDTITRPTWRWRTPRARRRA